MIAKVTKGTSFAGLTGYLYGPGRHEEHVDAHMVGGNLAVEDRARVIAEELRDVAQENPRVRRPVFHASLALPDGERLSDEQWQRAGERFMDEMGFRAGDSEAPWAIVRHDGQEGRHAHIVASRVRFDGSTVSDSYDYKRSHQACRAVEADHGLSSPQLSAERLASVSRSERESAQRRGVAPERGELRQALEEARDSGDGTREDFERRAGERGVLLRANESASTGRMNGYSASLEGWTDAQGQQVWMPASKVHKSLRWQQLQNDLAERRRQHHGAEPPPPLSQAARAMRADTETQKTPAISSPAPSQIQQEEDAPMPSRQDDELAAANRRLQDELRKAREDKEHAEQQYVNHMHRAAVWNSQPDTQRTAEPQDSQVEQQQVERESELVEQRADEQEQAELGQEAELVEEEQSPGQTELVDEHDEPEPRESEAARVMRQSREREREQEQER